jgi:hypothetical protein
MRKSDQKGLAMQEPSTQAIRWKMMEVGFIGKPVAAAFWTSVRSRAKRSLEAESSVFLVRTTAQLSLAVI